MYHFAYVSKREAGPARKELCQIIHEVQDRVRGDFTFQFISVGSSSRNMITYDRKSNIGFDFDFDLVVNCEEGKFSPKEIRKLLKNAFDQAAPKYGYECCEDSTRVLTMKKIDRPGCRILCSCDFAIVHKFGDGKQRYIRYDKKSNRYTWELQAVSREEQLKKMDWLKDNHFWGEFRQYYLKKKNLNQNPHKHSRSIFMEALNEMYKKKGGPDHTGLC